MSLIFTCLSPSLPVLMIMLHFMHENFLAQKSYRMINLIFWLVNFTYTNCFLMFLIDIKYVICRNHNSQLSNKNWVNRIKLLKIKSTLEIIFNKQFHLPGINKYVNCTYNVTTQLCYNEFSLQFLLLFLNP